MLLFSFPVTYLGIILAVFIHEVIGHGLSALLLGGQFNGFGLALDGLGWAKLGTDHLPAAKIALILLAGSFSTAVFSLFCIALWKIFRKHHFTALTFLFLSITSALDGLPYFFWDAIYQGGIGDFSVIQLLYPRHGFRIPAILVSGLLMLFVLIWFNVAYYRLACGWLGNSRPARKKEKILIAGSIFLLQCFGWFSFDWNQLVPGVGLIPTLSALTVVLIILSLSVAFQKPGNGPILLPVLHRPWFPLAAAWIACAGIVFVILQWLQYGVSFF